MSASKQPPVPDPRVLRSRAAAVAAARKLFLEKGLVGTTMEDIAAAANLSKRTLYNVYSDKNALFLEVVGDAIAYAEKFAGDLDVEFESLENSAVASTLRDLGQRLALVILRPDVVALRRLLVREADEFPNLAREYYDRAPGRVLAALARGFSHLHASGALHLPDPLCAAEQFAYLVAGAHLDRGVLLGVTPDRAHVLAAATDGVETFLARYRCASS